MLLNVYMYYYIIRAAASEYVKFKYWFWVVNYYMLFLYIKMIFKSYQIAACAVIIVFNDYILYLSRVLISASTRIFGMYWMQQLKRAANLECKNKNIIFFT